mmetsp:Transcript_13424/g.27946  ORF Transcript_13424/g.27946 Transcript_13424/m.27946 type:complete len:86 (+) Transcript_13424:812-1069(+)
MWLSVLELAREGGGGGHCARDPRAQSPHGHFSDPPGHDYCDYDYDYYGVKGDVTCAACGVGIYDHPSEAVVFVRADEHEETKSLW